MQCENQGQEEHYNHHTKTHSQQSPEQPGPGTGHLGENTYNKSSISTPFRLMGSYLSQPCPQLNV